MFKVNLLIRENMQTTRKGRQKQNQEKIVKQPQAVGNSVGIRRSPLYRTRVCPVCPPALPGLPSSSPDGPFPFPMHILPTPEPQLRVLLPTKGP